MNILEMKKINFICEKCKKEGAWIVNEEFFDELEKGIAKEVLNEVIKELHNDEHEDFSIGDIVELGIKQLAKDKYNIKL